MKLCILNSSTNKCVNIIEVANENDWQDTALLVKSSRHDGQIGWLLVNGEWQTNARIDTYDEKCEKVRSRRNKYLQQTDIYMIEDYPITVELKDQLKTYRQELRNITAQAGFPDSVIWPTRPS